MVQLKAPQHLLEYYFDTSFNSKMVQLKVPFQYSIETQKYLSIPKWYN